MLHVVAGTDLGNMIMNQDAQPNLSAAGIPEVSSRKEQGQSKPTPTLGKQLVHCLIALVIALTSYWGATHFVFQKVVVDGDSMKPTLHDSDTYMLNRVELWFRKPQVGDIVVIRDPEVGCLAIKRVVAEEGQSVELDNGSVFVNGLKLSERYLQAGTLTFSYHNRGREEFKCGSDQYFVLGDNRPVSADSRVYGPVPRQNILGIVVP
jgi:signal peptidase I